MVHAIGPLGVCTVPKSRVCPFTAVTRPQVRYCEALTIDLIAPPADSEPLGFGDGDKNGKTSGLILLLTTEASHLWFGG